MRYERNKKGIGLVPYEQPKYVLTTAKEVEAALNDFGIVGKSIAHIDTPSSLFNMSIYYLYDFARLPSNWWSDEETIEVKLHIDSILVIEFDDGARIGIMYIDDSCLQINTECMPENMVMNTTLDIKAFFSDVIGVKVVNYMIEEDNDSSPFFYSLPEQTRYIKCLWIDFENGYRIRLEHDFDGYWDFVLTDENGETIQTTYGMLKNHLIEPVWFKRFRVYRGHKNPKGAKRVRSKRRPPKLGLFMMKNIMYFSEKNDTLD